LEETEVPHESPPRILVQNAGNQEVNGIYARGDYRDGHGLFQGISMYARRGLYKGEPCLYNMFQCLVGSKTKWWFVSVIPPSGRPGTDKDINFFSAVVTDDCLWIPPKCMEEIQ
jgi:hypothetical protein